MAGGLVIAGGSPRAIGRAGVGTVGDDGAGALLVNPAAIARREGKRAQVGLAFVDDEIFWYASDDVPVGRNQSASDFAPTGAAFASIGSWVIGLGAMTAAITDRELPTELPPQSAPNAYGFRYAGVAGAFQRDTVTLGVARRIGDHVAVGVALGASRVTISEARRVWAGFSGVAMIGDPENDVELAFAGTDWFAPSATAGVLFAPSEAPLELAASVAWMQTVVVEGDAGGRTADVADAPRLVASNTSASMRVRQPITVRGGARYIGERFVVEAGGDLWIAADSASQTAWSVRGMKVIDRSTRETPIASVPSRLSMRTHGALRVAGDVELIGGFLWATGGYAYQVAGVAGSRQSPSFGDLGGHTMALGLEGNAGGFTFTLGWSRTWSVKTRPESTLALDNPFRAGDRVVPLGTYDGSIDQIGILLDAELDLL